MNREVTVKVPATSANLGPGFDVIGLALDIYCNVSYALVGESLIIEGCPEKYANSKNLAYTSFCKTLRKTGKQVPAGLKIRIDSDIPISRGLGSSSALIVSGIEAANYLYELQLDDNEILTLATEIEGHPDNVAPCIFGGMVSSYLKDCECFEVHHQISGNLRFAVLIPSYTVSTEQARGILPANITRQDAVFSVAHYGLLINGFATGNAEILKEALFDKIHQPYRKTLIKDFDRYHKLALDCGAYGMVISGSGSTMLIVGDSQTDFISIQNEVGDDTIFKKVNPCLEGAECQTNF